jgi:glycosyltransferase involved in cell wall biosynthesis
VSRRGADDGHGERAHRPEVVELDVAFSVNRSAAETPLVKMSDFGRFIVVMSGYPAGSRPASHAPGHDYLREALGPIAVAEVGLHRWLISDRHKAVEIPVGPSRPNLWRLLRNAEVFLDLRPQGVVGRETLESLLLGTPVVVPEGTVAAEHAERSNGGLWYRDYRELLEAAGAILDRASLREQLGRQGQEWAERVHGDQERFSEQAARLVLP